MDTIALREVPQMVLSEEWKNWKKKILAKGHPFGSPREWKRLLEGIYAFRRPAVVKEMSEDFKKELAEYDKFLENLSWELSERVEKLRENDFSKASYELSDTAYRVRDKYETIHGIYRAMKKVS